MLARWLTAGLLVLGFSPALCRGQPAASPEDPVFGLTRMHVIHVHVEAKDYAAMDPAPPKMQFPPAPRPGMAPGDAGAGNFGFEFDYVPATVEVDGQTFKPVGLRYKGSGTYMASMRNVKRSLKIDFDRHDSKLAWQGLAKINLNSGVMDPTKAREALAYEVFRTAGVPAPRTAFAEVTLTVPGKFDRELLGVFTLVEQVDKRFLKTHFKNGKGLLLKPEGIRGLPYLGDDVANYEKLYVPKSDPNEGDWDKLKDLTRLINGADEATFKAQIGTRLEVEAFTKFLAANTLLSSLDGFLGMGHNYYLYLNPATGKFTFFPWDLDLAFGGFFLMGQPDHLADLSIDHPHSGDNKLIDRLLAIPEVKASYRAALKKLTEDLLASGALERDVETVEAFLKQPVERDRKAAEARKEGGGFGFGFPPGGPSPATASLKGFVQKRSKSIAAQFAGTSKGTQATMSFGPPGGFGPQPPGAQLARPLMERLDADRNGQVSEAEFETGMKALFQRWDKSGRGSLDLQNLTEGLQQLLPPPGPPPRP